MAFDRRLALTFCALLSACQASPLPYLAPCRDQESQLVQLYERYSAAKKNLTAAGNSGDFKLTEHEWNSWLTPLPECPFQATSIASLAARHRQLIRQARIEAATHPSFDLGKIRANSGMLHKFCAEIPKGALLHVHPGGAFAETPLVDLGKRAAKQGLQYVEVSEGLPVSVGDGTPSATIFENIDALAEKLKDATGVTFRWKVLFDGDVALTPASADPARAMIQALDELLKKHKYPKSLVGVDIAEVESSQALIWLKTSAELLNHPELPLKHTFHAVISSGRNLARDAIVVGANQLRLSGDLAADPVTLDWARRSGVLLEVRGKDRGLLMDYISLGIPVAMAGGNMNSADFDFDDECVVAVAQTDIAYPELKQLFFTSVQRSFAEPDLKAQLSTRLEKDYTAFEDHWKDVLESARR